MPLSVTVLGCSGTWASADSACSGYLVDDGTTKLWLDCGPGTLGALQRHAGLDEVDALVVSHSHPDHCMELPVLRNALLYGLGLKNMPLIAPRDVLKMLETLVTARGISPSFAPRMVGDRSSITVKTLKLSFSRTDHPVETLAMRVDPADGSGPGFVYSADTGPGWSVSRFGSGVGLAFMEGTFLAHEVGESDVVHLTARQAGEDARKAGVARLGIIHVPPTGDGEAHRAEAEEAFGAPVLLARPHETYVVDGDGTA